VDKYIIIGIVSGLISLLGYLPYVLSILKGRTKPNRATWIIWTVIGMLLVASYYFTGDIKAIWVPLAFFVGPFIVMILSFFYGQSNWSILDISCLIAAALSLIAWVITGDPLVALLINVFIDFLGAIPTLHKTFLNPETEDLKAWVLFFIGSAINIAAIITWDITIIYPLYLVAITFSMVIILLFINPRKIPLNKIQ
jgi:hypothetical protein